MDMSNLDLLGLDSSKDRFAELVQICESVIAELAQARQINDALTKLTESQDALLHEVEASRAKLIADVEAQGKRIQAYLVERVQHWHHSRGGDPSSTTWLTAQCYFNAYNDLHTKLFGTEVPV